MGRGGRGTSKRERGNKPATANLAQMTSVRGGRYRYYSLRLANNKDWIIIIYTTRIEIQDERMSS